MTTYDYESDRQARDAAFSALVAGDNKIQFIKAVRNGTGAALLDAKHAVDRLFEDLKQITPTVEKYTAQVKAALVELALHPSYESACEYQLLCGKLAAMGQTVELVVAPEVPTMFGEPCDERQLRGCSERTTGYDYEPF